VGKEIKRGGGSDIRENNWKASRGEVKERKGLKQNI